MHPFQSIYASNAPKSIPWDPVREPARVRFPFHAKLHESSAGPVADNSPPYLEDRPVAELATGEYNSWSAEMTLLLNQSFSFLYNLELRGWFPGMGVAGLKSVLGKDGNS